MKISPQIISVSMMVGVMSLKAVLTAMPTLYRLRAVRYLCRLLVKMSAFFSVMMSSVSSPCIPSQYQSTKSSDLPTAAVPAG